MLSIDLIVAQFAAFVYFEKPRVTFKYLRNKQLSEPCTRENCFFEYGLISS